MESPFARIFIAIQKHIKAQVPEVLHIDHDLGQLEGYTHRPEIAFPAVLIDLPDWQTDDLGDNAQQAEGDVIIKLGFAQHLQSSSHFSETHIKEALTYYELEQKIHTALQGWSVAVENSEGDPTDDMGNLSRRGRRSENRPMGIRVCVVRYRLAFEDDSAMPERGTAWGA